uniref:Uncharacterized protein n=1 Tax=Anguilla anguilla TaxID=7936 RepID=A0A0E9VRH2_ANGAN
MTVETKLQLFISVQIYLKSRMNITCLTEDQNIQRFGLRFERLNIIIQQITGLGHNRADVGVWGD